MKYILLYFVSISERSYFELISAIMFEDKNVQMNGLDALYVALTMQSEMCARALSLHQVP